MSGLPVLQVDEFLNVTTPTLISFKSSSTTVHQNSTTVPKQTKRKVKFKDQQTIQTRKLRGFHFNNTNDVELRSTLRGAPRASQERTISYQMNTQSADSREIFHKVSGIRVNHVQSNQRVLKISENGTTLLELSASSKPSIDRTNIITSLQRDFKPFSKSEAIILGQDRSLLQQFRTRAKRKSSSNSRYVQKQRFFIKNYLNQTKRGRNIKTIRQLEHFIEVSEEFPMLVESYIFTRALSGTDPKTIEGDLTALKTIWFEIKESKLIETYPKISETMKAIKHTFSKTKETSKPFRYKELHQYFRENKPNNPTETLLLCAQKMGFIFTTRPQAIFDLRENEFVIEKMILDLNQTKTVGKIRIFNAKTTKNQNCYQDHYSNTHDHGFDLLKLKKLLDRSREPNRKKYLFFTNGKKLNYSDGYKFFQKTIENFKSQHPEYKDTKFTPGSFRISSMTIRYKFEKKIVDKLRNRAAHSQKGRTMEKSYLIKDPTLTFLNE